jgi:hypothetical protein
MAENVSSFKANLSRGLEHLAKSDPLQDWQVLCSLNEMAGAAKPPMDFESEPIATIPGDPEVLAKAEAVLRDNLPSLDLPFRQPDLELLGVIGGVGQATTS